MKTATPTIPTPDDAALWHEGRLYLADQRILPERVEFLSFDQAAAVAEAIQAMVVRGAPAIGVAAAYGVVLAGRSAYASAGSGWKEAIEGDLQRLAASRPTAVNLFWAIRRMRALIEHLETTDPTAALLNEALAIHAEDRAANRRLGELGAELIEGPTDIITHCNAGALATGGYGTALGVVRSAFAVGKIRRVFADETRPWMQGARLTAWELMHDGIPVTLQADGAAASLMAGGLGWLGHCRLGSHRRQWRCGEQDRNLWPGCPGPLSRHQGDGRGTDLDRGYGGRIRRRNSDRGTGSRRTAGLWRPASRAGGLCCAQSGL